MNTSAFKLILFQSRALLTHHDHIRHHHNNNRCPPCKSFTPLLIDFYNANKEDLEIIFLSSDRDEESFNGYFGKMPWLSSIPGYSSQEANGRQKKLASMFQIQVREVSRGLNMLFYSFSVSAYNYFISYICLVYHSLYFNATWQ
jgi:thiol-disulfide isomerase/thioredoxin